MIDDKEGAPVCRYLGAGCQSVENTHTVRDVLDGHCLLALRKLTNYSQPPLRQTVLTRHRHKVTWYVAVCFIESDRVIKAHYRLCGGVKLIGSQNMIHNV